MDLLENQTIEPEQKVLFDAARVSPAALWASRKNLSPLQALFLLPLLFAVYWIKRLARSAWRVVFLASRTPKYHPFAFSDVKKLDKKAWGRTNAFLADSGYEPLMDLEERGMPQMNFRRIYANENKTVFVEVLVNRSTGKIINLVFETLLSKGKNKVYLSVSNSHGLKVRPPGNLKLLFFPGLSIKELYEKFQEAVSGMALKAQPLKPAQFLVLQTRIRRSFIDSGVKQGQLTLDGAGEPATGEAVSKSPKKGAISGCYFHPLNPAVRKCHQCGLALCEACYTEYDGKNYCDKCLKAARRENGNNRDIRPVAVSDKAPHFAGAGPRLASLLMDLLLVGSATAAVGLGIFHGLGFLLGSKASSLAGLLGFHFGAIFTVFYFIYPLKRTGQTPGMRLFGLYAVDFRGDPPDLKYAVIRFAYYLLSLIFIFPAIGFLFVFFRKRKQGLHDQLSGIFICAKTSLFKTIMAWILVAALLLPAGWQVYTRLSPYLFLLGGFSSRNFEAEVSLEPVRVTKFSEEDRPFDGLLLDDIYICSATRQLTAFDTRSGELLWNAPSEFEPILLKNASGLNTRLIVHEFHEQGPGLLIRLKPATGERLWEAALESGTADIADEDEFNLHYDENVDALIVNRGGMLRSYDPNSGKLLWKRRVEGWRVGFAILNDQILLSCYSDASTKLFYLNRQTGDTIWERANESLFPGLALGGGHQIFTRDNHKNELHKLDGPNKLWSSSIDAGPVLAYTGPSGADGPPLILYASMQALNGRTGETQFPYPPNHQFACQTNSYLLLATLPEREKDFAKEQATELLIADKKTGRILKKHPLNLFPNFVKLHENEEAIYLAANKLTARAPVFETEATLLIIDKTTLDLKQIILGKRLPLANIRVHPSQKRIFIPGNERVGIYQLP